MAHIDSEWQAFLQANGDMSFMMDIPNVEENNDIISDNEMEYGEGEPSPSKNARMECEELYISTQTKIFFLNTTNLDVDKIFWNTKVIPYTMRSNGVIKKQIRFISKNKEEYEVYVQKRDKELYYTEKIMKQIDNPNARKIKFKTVPGKNATIKAANFLKNEQSLFLNNSLYNLMLKAPLALKIISLNKFFHG